MANTHATATQRRDAVVTKSNNEVFTKIWSEDKTGVVEQNAKNRVSLQPGAPTASSFVCPAASSASGIGLITIVGGGGCSVCSAAGAVVFSDSGPFCSF